MQRPQRAVHERLAVATPEVEPEPQHLPMAFRQGLEPHRDLRHREEDVQELQSSRLCGVGTVPFEHVGVDRRRPGTQPQIDRANPVGKHVRGAVARAEHAAVLADRRTDVRLAELDENSRLDPVQVRHRLREQPVDRLGQRLDVASGVVLTDGRILAVEAEHVDEVELESVDVPLAKRVFVDGDQKCADFRETRIEHIGVEPVNPGEKFAAETLQIPALLPDKRHRIPDQILHAELVNFRNMSAHVGEAVLRDLPVAAIGVTAVAVVGLPAVVDDDSFHPAGGGETALGLEFPVEQILVEAVPARINRIERGSGNRGGGAFGKGFIPAERLAQNLGVEKMPGVEAQHGLIGRKRRLGNGKEFDRAGDLIGLLADSSLDFDGPQRLRERESQAVLPIESAELDRGNLIRQRRFQRRAPVRRNVALKRRGRMPAELHIELRHPPFEPHVRRIGQLRRAEREVNQFHPRFRGLFRARQIPVAQLSRDPDLADHGCKFHKNSIFKGLQKHFPSQSSSGAER